MKDWQGNEIKDGDIVVKIYTKPILDPNSFFWMTPKGENIPMFDEEIVLDKYWEEIREYEIKQIDEYLMSITKVDEFTILAIAEFTIPKTQKGDQVVYAIKGKSDKKELYYDTNNISRQR
jgi:hypothetical protein